LISTEELLIERDGATLVATVERGDDNLFSPPMVEALSSTRRCRPRRW
jgi:hypothetical protein